MNSYQILNAWEGFCRKNPRLVRPIHHSILLHAIIVCNRLQWPNEFQYPTDVACQFIGIVDRETFHRALKQLQTFGAIREVQAATGLHVARFVSFLDCGLYLAEKSEGTPEGSPVGSGNPKPTHQPKPAKTKPSVSPFVESPPSDDDVKEYFIQSGGPLSFAQAFTEAFKAHYELLGWTYGKGKSPIKDWKAAVRTWQPQSWQPRAGSSNSGNPALPSKSTQPPFRSERR